MFDLPSIPSWNALHPGISHFPIVLLLVVPVLLFLALSSPARRQQFIIAAFWVLLAGTISVYLSAATGDAAKEVAPKTPEITKAIEQHENLGSTVRALSTVFAVILAAFLFGPRFAGKQLSPKAGIIFLVVFFILYLVSTLILVNTGHSGALLVHKLGVHVKIN